VTILNVVIIDNIIPEDNGSDIQSLNNIKVYITPSGLLGLKYNWNVFGFNKYESKY
jgi:hypothetical protein